MNQSKIQNYLSENVSILKGVGIKIQKILKRKKIDKISDLLWSFPQGFTDRTNIKKLNNLEIGKITTVKILVKKHNFPRIRNLPNKVLCEDECGKIDIVFFNSREGYIRSILPLNKVVVVSGKINFFNKKYQMTNPQYIVPDSQEDIVNKVIPKYSLTEGLTEKIYRKLIDQVLSSIKNINEWHDKDVLSKIGNVSWSNSIYQIHNNKNISLNNKYRRRLAYDEILSNHLVLSQVRKRVKRIKKVKKFFNKNFSKKVISSFKFKLTNDQIVAINEINSDIKSDYKMFRLLQGDVGSGKTIVAFVAAINVINSNWQVALMAPTEILAKQHFNLAIKVFKTSNIKIEFISGKTNLKDKNDILQRVANGEIDLLIGTHSLFQKKIKFKNLGLAIIDEQHKFGVRQRIELANKGGRDCDILLMSATPIPRSLILAFYGDMNVSKITEKPVNRKKTITLSKPEEKINEIILYTQKIIKSGHQVFWVCPLIEESKKLDYESAVNKFNYLSKKFPGKVGLIHGALDKDQKNVVLESFLKKDIKILVSTTVIEVGIDFPNANLIVIENSNKFGLSQLHQLRGRVGRGKEQATCILLYKKNLSENAKKRIKILKSSDDGFFISEADMKLRGFGDVLGYQQSGLKNFKLADPIQHRDLFDIADQNIKKIENNNFNIKKYDFLLKLFDKADIINEINQE